jgi:hypothetical protein
MEVIFGTSMPTFAPIEKIVLKTFNSKLNKSQEDAIKLAMSANGNFKLHTTPHPLF